MWWGQERTRSTRALLIGRGIADRAVLALPFSTAQIAACSHAVASRIWYNLASCPVQTEKDKMLAGELYSAADPELQAELLTTQRWLARYNAALDPEQRHTRRRPNASPR